MNIEGILFDLDGTLADTLPVCVQAFQATVANFCGSTPDEAEIFAGFGPSEEGMLEQLIPGRLAETLPYYLDRYEHFHAQCTGTFPGIDGLLSTLKQRGIRTAIVTGKGPGSAAISMRLLGLSNWVDTLETGFAAGAKKAYSMGLVLQRWGMPPQRAAYAGDTPEDMLAARAAGLLPLGAAWAETSALRNHPVANQQPTFDHLEQFIRWVETNCAPSSAGRAYSHTPSLHKLR
jgi:phosphoglycolate phosphatase-like HAD superfamily hydrolase